MAIILIKKQMQEELVQCFLKQTNKKVKKRDIVIIYL